MDPVLLIVSIVAIIFFFWLVLVVPYKMANNRGRSPILWVLISVLVSPLVSIIVLAAIGPAEEKTLSV